MKGWGIVPAVLVLGLARSSPVWGEQQEPILLEEVQVTAARAPRIAFDVPTGVTVVGPEEISRQTPQVLSDLMRGAAGVFVQQTTPGQATAIVRGLKGSEVLHLVDGMRLNNAFFRNAPNQYLALVDPYNVERVEVVRGPASTLYGSDAMGGVVQVITPVPRFDTEEWQVQGRALGQFASAELAGVTRLSVEGGKRGIALRGGFTYQNVDDRRAGGGHRQRPSGFTAHAADGTMVLTLGSNHEVLLNVQYLRQPKTPRFDELVAGFGQTQPSADVFFFEPNDRLFLHGRYRTLQPVAFIDLVELNVAHQQIDDDRRIRDFGSSEEDRERNQSALTGITLQGISEAGERMNFTYGGELYLDTINSSRKRTNILTGERVAVRSRFPDGSTMNSFALYVRDEIRLSPPLVATFGGRFSHFDLDLPGTDGETGTTLSFHDVTGSFGLRYRLTPVLNLVANVGRGFRAPNVFDLGTSGPRPGNRFNIANPDLGPEKIVTVDWGVKLQAPRLQGQVFGFYSDFTDKIESVLTGDQTPDGRDVVQSRNVNRVILWGGEVGARLQLRDDLGLSGSLTFTWGEERFPDGRQQPADRIPPLNGRVGLLYRPRPTLRVEPFVRFAAPQDRLSDRDIRDPRIDPRGTAGWATGNVRLGWDIHPHVGVRLAIENLTDLNYREHGSGIDAPGFNAVLSFEGRF